MLTTKSPPLVIVIEYPLEKHVSVYASSVFVQVMRDAIVQREKGHERRLYQTPIILLKVNLTQRAATWEKEQKQKRGRRGREMHQNAMEQLI